MKKIKKHLNNIKDKIKHIKDIKKFSKRIEYKVYLKDGSFVVIWFLGNQLERICKAYNIKYEIVDIEK